MHIRKHEETCRQMRSKKMAPARVSSSTATQPGAGCAGEGGLWRRGSPALRHAGRQPPLGTVRAAATHTEGRLRPGGVQDVEAAALGPSQHVVTSGERERKGEACTGAGAGAVAQAVSKRCGRSGGV